MCQGILDHCLKENNHFWLLLNLVDCWTEVRLSITLGLANMSVCAFSLLIVAPYCLFSRRSVCSFVCLFLVFLFHSTLRPFSWRSVSPHCCQCPLVSQRPHSCPSTSATLSRETFSQMHIHALAKRVKGTFDCTSYQIRDHVCAQKKNTKDFSRSLHSIGKQF